MTDVRRSDAQRLAIIKAPDFVLEVASPNTWREDEGAKRRVYERLGVREYCQYDPTGEFLGTRLKGARLAAGRYETLAAGRSASGGPTLSSEVLQLELFIDGEGEFRFRDPVTGQVLLSHLEEHVRADREAAARRAAEARIAELLRERRR